ncbi:MAG: hypothetical protein C0467_04100 [Planctomycetaceae bacterium]|nr:hypothetical protein [Planctomycetaceae bacterium]
MSMPPYTVMCYRAGCPNPAEFKIAARWNDGLTHELKTYSLVCASCLPALFAQALVKRAACRLAPGETLDKPGIYELHRGGRDKQLKRRTDLETVTSANG